MDALYQLKKQLAAVLDAHTDPNGMVDYAKVNTDVKFKEFQVFIPKTIAPLQLGKNGYFSPSGYRPQMRIANIICAICPGW